MAFTRKFLSALGIEAEKIDEIMTAHVEVTDGLKSDLEKYKNDSEKLADVEKKLAEAEEKIAKNSDTETVPKVDFDNLQNKLADYEKKEILQSKQTAYGKFLKDEVHISEKRIPAVLRLTNLDEIEFDENGAIKNAEERAKIDSETWSDYVVETSETGADTAKPPKNNPTAKDPFEIGFDG